MDLIDRSKIDFYKLTGPELVSAMEEAPSVPAVPLDKLCEWLEKNATMDCNLCHATIGSCEDDDVNENVCNSRERWKKC